MEGDIYSLTSNINVFDLKSEKKNDALKLEIFFREGIRDKISFNLT